MSDFKSIPVTTATAEDAAELAAHVNAGYRGESSRAGWTTEADLLDGTRISADRLRTEIAKVGHRFEVMRNSDGEIIASVELALEGRTGSAPVCYLGMLTVRPTLQGGGIAKRILGHADRVAREWGCDRIRIGVIDLRKELIAYYERRGFVRTGVLLPFHFDDPSFGTPRVPMKLVELVRILD